MGKQLKHLPKHLLKMLLNDFPININYLKVIQQIPWREKCYIKFLRHNDLVITKADKGGTTLILDVKQYISKANKDDKNKQLQNIR